MRRNSEMEECYSRKPGTELSATGSTDTVSKTYPNLMDTCDKTETNYGIGDYVEVSSNIWGNPYVAQVLEVGENGKDLLVQWLYWPRSLTRDGHMMDPSSTFSRDAMSMKDCFDENKLILSADSDWIDQRFVKKCCNVLLSDSTRVSEDNEPLATYYAHKSFGYDSQSAKFRLIDQEGLDR